MDDAMFTDKPWLQFSVGDWRNLVATFELGPIARAVLLEIRLAMHVGPSDGRMLTATGEPMSVERLSIISGLSLGDCQMAVDELCRQGLLAWQDHTIVWPMILRQREISRKRSEAGAAGGRPKAKHEAKHEAKRQANSGSGSGSGFPAHAENSGGGAGLADAEHRDCPESPDAPISHGKAAPLRRARLDVSQDGFEPHVQPGATSDEMDGNGHIPQPVWDALVELCGGAHRVNGKARDSVAGFCDKYGPDVARRAIVECQGEGKPWGRIGWAVNRIVKREEDAKARPPANSREARIARLGYDPEKVTTP